MQAKLVRHTIIFSLFVFLAQILGLLRDLYLARAFGVSQTLDIYYMAFKVPDFLNVFYSVFLGSVVFIPLLTAARDKQEKIQKVRNIGSLVLVLVLVVGLLLFVFMPYILELLVPTWSGEQLTLLLHLSRLLLLAQFFFPIGILAGSLAMIYERPFYMAVSGFVYNFFILFCSMLLVPWFGIYGVVVGIILGAIAFAAIQIYPKEVREIIFSYRFVVRVNEWVVFFKTNFARFLAVLAYQLFGVLLLYIASFAGVGGVSAFSIAYNIFLALFFILGASLSTASMPNIAKLHVSGDKELQEKNLNNSLVYMFFVGAFFTLFGYVFSFNIVKILYFFSNIGEEKEVLIASTLALLILALPFFNLLEVIRKYLYSTNQIKIASFVTLFLLFGVMILDLVCEKIFHFETLTALGTAIFISNILALLFALFTLKYKAQIDLIFLLRNSYKVLLVSLSSFLAYHFTINIVFGLSGLYFANFFLETILRGCTLLVIFVLFTFVWNDEIGENIFCQVRKLVF
jgi:putative peptidoglycan lipid II flippase